MLTLPHIHLLLNHFPTVGFSIGLGLFLVSLLAKNDNLKRASLAVFFVIGFTTIAVYVSGVAAQVEVAALAGVSQVTVKAHEDAALLAFIFMQITGAVAFIALWQYRRISRPAAGVLPAVLFLSIVTFGLMTRAADIGGEIRHPEIVPTQEPAAVGFEIQWLKTASIAGFVAAHRWVWPTSETLHFIGLSFLFTTVLVIDLRILGMAKGLSLAVLHKLLPLGLLSFGVNLITGIVFFTAAPEQYTGNPVFFWKIVLIVLAGLNALYFVASEEAWVVGPGDEAPLRAKVFAASAIFLWLGVLYCGHMLPFIGNAF